MQGNYGWLVMRHKHLGLLVQKTWPCSRSALCKVVLWKNIQWQKFWLLLNVFENQSNRCEVVHKTWKGVWDLQLARKLFVVENLWKVSQSTKIHQPASRRESFNFSSHPYIMTQLKSKYYRSDNLRKQSTFILSSHFISNISCIINILFNQLSHWLWNSVGVFLDLVKVSCLLPSFVVSLQL